MHVDYSENGLKAAARYNRKDICDVAQPALDAEDRGERPRYAPVRRDPIAVLDWRSVDESEVVATQNRALSAVLESGEFMREMLIHVPPKCPEALRYYWVPDQQPDEVLIIKFADTGATDGSGIAKHCIHGSCVLPGTEDEPARESIECRVMAFFD
ncbi:putative hydroxylase/desaturase AsaB [Septoria linicola]|nr:putative hydroxylase/desaturase AsaB [Septoria linicola]